MEHWRNVTDITAEVLPVRLCPN